MRIKLAVIGMILAGIAACAQMGGMAEKEKIYGKNPPVIGQSFGSDQLRPGGQWKIYILASDPGGDMETLVAVVDQAGMGSYPMSWTRIKEENARELSGYFYLNTDGPYGTAFLRNQELTATGRALMSDPRLLMLDEPSLGLAPLVVMHIMDTLAQIKKKGTAILLVEQNAAESLRIAHHGYVFEIGSVVLADSSENLMSNEKVKQAYVGA